jgi:L-threonylcarbamoyladenylate synthase
LIVHILSINQLGKWAVDIPEYALKLANEFWPGPMTLILKRSALAKDFITGGQDSVGVRVPKQPIAQALLYQFNEVGGLGVAAPSANRFGAVSPTRSSAVGEELGDNLGSGDFILDGGQSQIGIESTIIDCTDLVPEVLRPGIVTLDMITTVTSLKLIYSSNKIGIRASGLMGSHYSPNARVLLNELASPGDGLLAMADIPTPNGVTRLASPKNVEQYARELYEALRSGDQMGIQRIIVIPPEGDGIAEAVRDRLLKASSR